MGSIKKDLNGNHTIDVSLDGEGLMFTLEGDGWNGFLRVHHWGVAGEQNQVLLIPVNNIGLLYSGMVQILEHQRMRPGDQVEVRDPQDGRLLITFQIDGTANRDQTLIVDYPTGSFPRQLIRTKHLSNIASAIAKLLASGPSTNQPELD